MNLTTDRDSRTTTNLDARANLDIKLDGWHGVAAVGIIGATVVAVAALFFRSRD